MAAANLTSSKGRGWSLACHDPQLLPIGLDPHDPLRRRLAVELKQSRDAWLLELEGRVSGLALAHDRSDVTALLPGWSPPITGTG